MILDNLSISERYDPQQGNNERERTQFASGFRFAGEHAAINRGNERRGRWEALN
jgi:hypothetical protein